MNKLPVGILQSVAFIYWVFKAIQATINITNGEKPINITLMPSAIWKWRRLISSTPFHKLQSENVDEVELFKKCYTKDKGTATTLAEGITDIPVLNVVSTGVALENRY